MISIITPTFNRKDQVIKSIKSSLDLIKNIKGEIIVIDDASNDGTYNFLLKTFKEEIKKKKIKLLRLKKNIGVTGARNTGAKKSIYKWIIFLDSDDTFISKISNELKSRLIKLSKFDLIFFRCLQGNSKKLIGPYKKNYELKFIDFLNNGTPGECLLAIKRATFLKNQYDESFNGCEGLTYLKVLFNGKKCYVSDFAVRIYNTTAPDRLSNFASRLSRSKELYRFHLIRLKYLKYMTFKNKINTFLKINYYFILKIINDYL